MKNGKRITVAVLAILLLSGCVKTDKTETTTTTAEPTATTQAGETESQGKTEAASSTTAKETEKNTAAKKTEKFTKSTVRATKPSTTPSTKVHTTAKREPNTFADYNNTPAYDSVITKTYDESDIVAKYIKEEVWGKGFSERKSYEALNAAYPAECVRNSGNNVYAIYKTKQGGLFYVFFDEGMDIKHCAYSTKKLSHSDFAQVKEGTPIAEVEKIEPAVAVLKNYWYKELTNPSTIHILTDGVLKIFYQKSPETREYTVWKTVYSKDFIFDYSLVSDDSFFADGQLDYRILPSDYVN